MVYYIILYQLKYSIYSIWYNINLNDIDLWFHKINYSLNFNPFIWFLFYISNVSHDLVPNLILFHIKQDYDIIW